MPMIDFPNGISPVEKKWEEDEDESRRLKALRDKVEGDKKDLVLLKELRRAEERSEAKLKRMSPPGSLGLNPLLEKRRWRFGLVDKIFSINAVYDRIYVYQADPVHVQQQRYGDTGIIAPQETVDREVREAPRGILISAGVRALDYLRSHGIALGHMVYMGDPSPLGHTVDYVHHKLEQVMILTAGDLTGSEDLSRAMRSGHCKIVCDDEGNHTLVNRSDEPWDPLDLPEEDTA